MKSHDIAGYLYQADLFTPDNLIEYMIARGDLSPGARGMTVEDALDQHASALGIDRWDERTYDSGEFPKAVFADQWNWEG